MKTNTYLTRLEGFLTPMFVGVCFTLALIGLMTVCEEISDLYVNYQNNKAKAVAAQKAKQEAEDERQNEENEQVLGLIVQLSSLKARVERLEAQTNGYVYWPIFTNLGDYFLTNTFTPFVSNNAGKVLFGFSNDFVVSNNLKFWGTFTNEITNQDVDPQMGIDAHKNRLEELLFNADNGQLITNSFDPDSMPLIKAIESIPHQVYSSWFVGTNASDVPPGYPEIWVERWVWEKGVTNYFITYPTRDIDAQGKAVKK